MLFLFAVSYMQHVAIYVYKFIKLASTPPPSHAILIVMHDVARGFLLFHNFTSCTIALHRNRHINFLSYEIYLALGDNKRYFQMTHQCCIEKRRIHQQQLEGGHILNVMAGM